ncbi:Hypothetical_protein [Hexamita inflata]|uniref:Hypothetical_protein n=1 Tax=Hexamita inflata TaxID=28002 RepID=A0AA86U9F6_9EUKA|nr:Hypothetical protein HINF_LOCUS36315 [Hexamita inflata]
MTCATRQRAACHLYKLVILDTMVNLLSKRDVNRIYHQYLELTVGRQCNKINIIMAYNSLNDVTIILNKRLYGKISRKDSWNTYILRKTRKLILFGQLYPNRYFESYHVKTQPILIQAQITYFYLMIGIGVENKCDNKLIA